MLSTALLPIASILGTLIVLPDDVCNRVVMLKYLNQCRDSMLSLSDDSFNSNDIEQLISFLSAS